MSSLSGNLRKTTWYMEESMNGEIQQESATSIEYENENSEIQKRAYTSGGTENQNGQLVNNKKKKKKAWNGGVYILNLVLYQQGSMSTSQSEWTSLHSYIYFHWPFSPLQQLFPNPGKL